MMGTGQFNEWEFSQAPVVMPGYVYGLSSLSIRLGIRGSSLPAQACQSLWNWLIRTAEPESYRTRALASENQFSAVAPSSSGDLFLQSLYLLQSLAGLPVFESGIAKEQEHHTLFFIPTNRGSGPALVRTCEWLMEFFNRAGKGHPLPVNTSSCAEIIQELANTAPSTANQIWFMAAAFRHKIPLRRMPGNSFMVGQGYRSRLLESTTTDHTPAIACQNARNKPVTSEILRQFGFPVPVHKLVTSPDAAVHAASVIGYPVVVKPADRDRGEGVAANLNNADAVRKACAEAFRLSAMVMVEKHISGRDYRITVLNGKAIWAVERQPGSVTGDGRHSVRQLLEQVNAHPDRGQDRRSPLKKIELDDEVRELLAATGMTADSVPAAGVMIPLRRISNVTRGGVPVPVLDTAHPDNLDLAERAAQVMRLDIAGVDLLIPDIRYSWRESVAGICEINAQPTLGTYTASHLYGQILTELVKGDGRIPVILLAGASALRRADALEQALLSEGICTGLSAGNIIRIGGKEHPVAALNEFELSRLLVMDERVQAAMMVMDDEFLQTGLPVPYYDALVLDDQGAGQALQAMILPACDGVVLTQENPEGEVIACIRSRYSQLFQSQA